MKKIGCFAISMIIMLTVGMIGAVSNIPDAVEEVVERKGLDGDFLFQCSKSHLLVR